MLKKLLLGLLALIALAAITAYLTLGRPSPPDVQVFRNGQVFTMDGQNRIVSAIAVQGERIVAVGDDEDMAPYLEGALIHDLDGKTLLPGFIDAHGHFPGTGVAAVTVDLNSPPIGSVTSIADIQAALKAFAAGREPGQWVLALGYDDTLIAEHRHPTRDELDAVSTEHPIFVTHVSGHMGVANSRALALAGIDRDTPNPEGGVIVHDPETGELTGLLEETAMTPVQTLGMDFSAGEILTMLDTAIADYASKGITTAQSGGVDKGVLEGLHLASRIGYIPFRLEVWPFYKMIGPQVLDGEIDVADMENEWFHANAIKIVSDGSIQGYTGYLSHPYHTPFRGDDSYRGYPTFERDKLAEIVGKIHRAGIQMAIHANGDGAIDDVIYAFEKAQQAHPVADPRLILIHSQMARDDQLDAMKQLGITPSFFSAHTYYWGDRHRDIFIGPERASHISPTRSAGERDLKYTVHLDSPVVPMDPILLLWSTVNRVSTSGQVIGADERVPTMDALRAMTINAAWQIFREDELGSLEVGKFADLVVLDGDPLGDATALRELRVERTVVGGVTIYQRTDQ
ncbi:amidohydrolase [Parahaliea mediterranea]|uniref:amidohydrolase n=1 Tax=Parahaliea mediterranea TaxID=651086 RepID=UPI000E2F9717|nr:amidohydrolase [Parahaliea mediterranea]